MSEQGAGTAEGPLSQDPRTASGFPVGKRLVEAWGRRRGKRGPRLSSQPSQTMQTLPASFLVSSQAFW